MKHLGVTLLLLLATSVAQAFPLLQLDVAGGTYNNETESIEIEADSFNLYALFNGTSPAGPYYISASLAHVNEDGSLSRVLQSTPAPELGEFSFAGVTVSAASGMNYGTPTLLPSHGVFPTYYSQFSFNFSNVPGPSIVGPPTTIGVAPTSFGKFNIYNSQDEGHEDLTHNPNGNATYAQFHIDISNLDEDSALIFDFYTYSAQGKKLKIIKAPFSHNAGGGGNEQVPDGGHTLVLLGAAFAVGELIRRRATRR